MWRACLGGKVLVLMEDQWILRRSCFHEALWVGEL